LQETKEISALFHLIEDPDEEIFDTISDRIVMFGKGIIPNLEHLWEHTPIINVQERIEWLIYKVHYKDLTEEIKHWVQHPEPDILQGATLVAKYQYPALTTTDIYAEIEKMRRNIWLELNNYLTPLEQTNVITTILYGYYHLKGADINYAQPNDFLLPRVLESKRGNAFSNGILYMGLAELLDIPIRAIQMPEQFILAYFDADYNWLMPSKPAQEILFYIDPMTGHIFTQKDVEQYLARIAAPPSSTYSKPLSKKEVIKQLLEEFAKCFNEEGKNKYKQTDLLALASLLEEE
jgi:regulator of sirC expression with transglutaminase-like and TPR domain